ncbi:hypothetical protein DFAR_550011 [Desulfarculales bacterium]
MEEGQGPHRLLRGGGPPLLLGYSVPHQLVGKKLDIRYAERTVECFHKGQLVTSHRRILR